MKKSKSEMVDAGELRLRAEERFGARRAGAIAKNTNTPSETRRLFHELQVHQIELEMQNEELERARILIRLPKNSDQGLTRGCARASQNVRGAVRTCPKNPTALLPLASAATT